MMGTLVVKGLRNDSLDQAKKFYLQTIYQYQFYKSFITYHKESCITEHESNRYLTKNRFRMAVWVWSHSREHSMTGLIEIIF